MVQKINWRVLIASLLTIAIFLSGLSIQPSNISGAPTISKTIKIPFSQVQKYSSEVTLRDLQVNLSSAVPNGYQIKTYEIWKEVSSSNGTSLVNKGKLNTGTPINNKITIPEFAGALVDVENKGYTSQMYFALNRTINGKQWYFSANNNVEYFVSPPSDSDCWVRGIAECPGKMGKDINGKSIPVKIAIDSAGWALAISDGFSGPSTYIYKPTGDEIGFSKLKSKSVDLIKADPVGPSAFVKVLKTGKESGTDNRGYLEIATLTVLDNPLLVPTATRTGHAMSAVYNLDTYTNWTAQTYLYEGEVRLTLEPIPPIDQPYLDCTCKADPSTVTFADKAVTVNSTITATLKQRGSLKIKNWKVFARLEDGSQYQTQTIAQVLDTISYKFAFTIPKAQLVGRDSYTETFVMRAIVTFTDGTTAEQAIECATTVTKPGAATPTATATNGVTEPTPAPRPILEVNANWSPTSIFTGDQATLSAKARGYTDYSWELTENLDKLNFDQRDFSHPAVIFNEPGVYKATLNVSNDYESQSDTALLYVNDPKPVAIISGVTRWIQGRPFPQPYHLNNSFTPLSDRGVTIDFNKSEIRYKKNDSGTYTTGVWPAKAPDQLGAYTLQGKVHDSQGRESEWAAYPLEVVPDQPPVVELSAAEHGVRHNENMVYIDASSLDGDKLERLCLKNVTMLTMMAILTRNHGARYIAVRTRTRTA